MLSLVCWLSIRKWLHSQTKWTNNVRFDILKPVGCFMYHQVCHSIILRATHTHTHTHTNTHTQTHTHKHTHTDTQTHTHTHRVHLFVSCGSRDTEQLISFTELTDWFIGAFAKLFCKVTTSFVVSVSVCLFVRPHGTARLPLNGFSWNLVVEYFSKIPRENSSFF